MTTAVVVDASIVVDALTNASRRGELSRQILTEHSLFVPDLVYSEVGHVLRRMEAMSGVPLANDFAHLVTFPWTVIPFRIFGEGIWSLRHDMTLYDATYVGLARALGAPLITLDRKLASTASRHCEVWGPDRERE